MKIVVVGANHAGTSAIRTLRKLDKDVEIVAFDRNTDISFLGCGIALWVGGEFEDPEGLFYSNQKELVEKYNARVEMEHDVIEINQKDKYVIVKDLKTNEEKKETFDKLIFAGGTWPITIPVPGNDLNNIFFSKIFKHAQVLHDKNRDPKVKDVVIVGAGYIGIELTEAFQKAGKNATLVDVGHRVIGRYFDEEFTAPMQAEMKREGINFKHDETVTGFKGDADGNVTTVITDKGEYKADMVIMSAGFRPQTDILGDDIKKGPNGALIVDEYMRTSNKDIYAIGDSAQLKHNILGSAHVALATNAVKTGVVSAFHIAGKDLAFPGVNGTNAISVFGYNYASTGISAGTAKHMNIPYKSVYFEDFDKPDFMKDKEEVAIKIVYDPETFKLLGAQIGSHGKGTHTEVIYMFSLAIEKGMTLPELALLDVYFLPHFNKPFNFMLVPILKALGLDY